MGCDIHCFAEKQNQDGTFTMIDGLSPFDHRSYGTFGFLAGVRNYSEVTPIARPRGFPDDASDGVKFEFEAWGCDGHTPSWLSVDELSAFDYSQFMEDRRCSVKVGNAINCGATCEPGQGKKETFAQFLGKWFLDDIAALKESGATRVVFWFDN